MYPFTCTWPLAEQVFGLLTPAVCHCLFVMCNDKTTMDDVQVVATTSAKPFTDSATDLRDLREARKALRKGKLHPGDAKFDLVYARALATPKWYYSNKRFKEWRTVIEALMGESVELPPLFAGVLRSLITLLLSKPESIERALGLLTSLAKASGHISMNLVPMYRMVLH